MKLIFLALISLVCTQSAINNALSAFLESPTLSSLEAALQTNSDVNAKNSISLEINSLIESFILTYQGPTEVGPTGSYSESTAASGEQSTPETIVDTTVASTIQPSSPPVAPTQSLASTQAPSAGSALELPASSTPLPPLTTLLSTGNVATTSLPTGLLPHVESDLSNTGSYAVRASSFLGNAAVESLTSQWGEATDLASKQNIASELDNMYSIFISFTPTSSYSTSGSDQGHPTTTGTTRAPPAPTPVPGSITESSSNTLSASPSSTGDTESSTGGNVFANPQIVSLSQLFMTATDSQVQLSALSAINGLYSTLNEQYQASNNDSGQQLVTSTVAGSTAPTQGWISSSIEDATLAVDSTEQPLPALATSEPTQAGTSNSEVASITAQLPTTTSTEEIQVDTTETLSEPTAQTASALQLESTDAAEATTSTGPEYVNTTAAVQSQSPSFSNSTAPTTIWTQSPVAIEPPTGNGTPGNSSAYPSVPLLSNKAYNATPKIVAGVLVFGVFLLL